MRKIRTVFITNFLILALIPIFIFGSIVIISVKRSFTEEIETKQRDLALAVCNQIQGLQEHAEEDLRHIHRVLSSPSIVKSDGRPDFLNSIVENNRLFSALEIMDENGIIIERAPAEKVYIGMDMSEQPYFKHVSTEKDVFWGFSSIHLKSDTPSVSVTLRSKPYVITGFIDLSFLNEITKDIIIDDSGYVFITDANGTILAHPDADMVSHRVNIKTQVNTPLLNADNSRIRLHTERNSSDIITFASIEDAHWVVGITQKTEEVFSTVYFLISLLGVSVLVSASTALLAAIVNQRRVLNPITTIIYETKAIAEGDYDSVMPKKGNRIEELTILISAVESMRKSIRSREIRLENSRKKYRELVHNANSIIIRWNRHLHFTFFNEYAERFYGYTREEVIGKSMIGIIAPHRDSSSEELLEPLLREIIEHPEEYGVHENEGMKKNGERVWIQWSNKPIYDDNGIVREILSIGTDRTENKKNEERINDSLREKEVLIKEIHHRVKNNMQVISSLLNLQSNQVKEKNVSELLRESQMRVQSMALIHEQLYQSQDLSSIDFSDYVKDLIGFLADSYKIGSNQISFLVDAETIYFGIDEAIPCALILNELLSNAIKHAFPEYRGKERENRITIEMKKSNGTARFVVEDNGVGFPNATEFSKADSIGLQLVNALTEQINGTISIEADHGTKIELEFRPTT